MFSEDVRVVVDGIKDIMAYLAPCSHPHSREGLQKFRICRLTNIRVPALLVNIFAGIANNSIFF